MGGLIRYPCPLTRGDETVFVFLYLPSDLSMSDVQKIERMLEAIVLEQIKSLDAVDPVDGIVAEGATRV